MKKVRSSQAAILGTELSKTGLFPWVSLTDLDDVCLTVYTAVDVT